MNNTVHLLQKEFQNGCAVIKENISMKDFTTFKTGGNARVAVFPQSVEAMARTLKLIQGTKYCVLGNGSNVIFADEGYNGTVVFTTAMKEVTVRDGIITAQCGAGLTGISATALKNGLSGLEFAYGIPGSVGGAVFMNAGAYDGEMAQVVVNSTYIDKNGNIGRRLAHEHEFAYRHSVYMNTTDIIAECQIKLIAAEPAQIKAKMDENMLKRRTKQPLEYPSAGSTFKRPEGHFAGKLISDCGLKGYTVGGAQVSEKHAGFIINTGEATSNDILKLIDHIKGEVLRQFGVELECEVRYIC